MILLNLTASQQTAVNKQQLTPVRGRKKIVCHCSCVVLKGVLDNDDLMEDFALMTFNILDFKLSPPFECCILSFG
jgi:hypothetical protein